VPTVRTPPWAGAPPAACRPLAALPVVVPRVVPTVGTPRGPRRICQAGPCLVATCRASRSWRLMRRRRVSTLQPRRSAASARPSQSPSAAPVCGPSAGVCPPAASGGLACIGASTLGMCPGPASCGGSAGGRAVGSDWALTTLTTRLTAGLRAGCAQPA
jgi:hypothetical protein